LEKLLVKYEHVVHFYYFNWRVGTGGKMKFKYRRLMNMIFTLTLCLGVGMLGIVTPGGKYTIEGTAASDTKKKTDVQSSKGEGNTNETSLSISPTPISTPIPTPTPYPVYPLEDQGYPEAIDIFVDQYYKAKLSCDTDKLKSLHSSGGSLR